jgi:H+/gluconate symporter-like permease
MSSKKSRMEKKKDKPMAEQPTQPTSLLEIFFPIRPLIIKPIAGKSGTNQT